MEPYTLPFSLNLPPIWGFLLALLAVGVIVIAFQLSTITATLQEMLTLQKQAARPEPAKPIASKSGEGSDKGQPPDRSPTAVLGDISKVGLLKK